MVRWEDDEGNGGAMGGTMAGDGATKRAVVGGTGDWQSHHTPSHHGNASVWLPKKSRGASDTISLMTERG